MFKIIIPVLDAGFLLIACLDAVDIINAPNDSVAANDKVGIWALSEIIYPQFDRFVSRYPDDDNISY